MNFVTAAWLASLPEESRARLVDQLSQDEAWALLYDWRFWARPNQLPPPGQWRIWLLLAGRGFGKTRTGAEFVRARVAARTARRLALVAPTAADARGVMVEGESGILAVSPHWDRPRFEPSNRKLTWANGAIATLYSAEEPERLRGPQHDAAWCDEFASWRHPEAWDMLMFGLRVGEDPRVVVTTTPRPSPILRVLMQDPSIVVTRGATYENRHNLAADFLDQIVRRYEGTKLGRQEIDAEIIDDLPGALWSRSIIDATRLRTAPELARIVVAIDPAASSGVNADETGIIVAGKDPNGHGWVLADLSGRYHPLEWARTAIAAFHAHRADRVVAEVNHGGEMVESTLRVIEPDLPFTAVRATRGKITRAEPVAALYAQRKVHHLGSFPQLEDQMCSLVGGSGDGCGRPGFSPDRVDALVWALTDLLLSPMIGEGIFEIYRQLSSRAPSGRGDQISPELRKDKNR